MLEMLRVRREAVDQEEMEPSPTRRLLEDFFSFKLRKIGFIISKYLFQERKQGINWRPRQEQSF